MNKSDFLGKLRQSVCMLEDSEQADIINEYAQHIDMKVQSGMTEAEAIADFGPIDELVSEVLAAYHVKAPEAKPVSASQSFMENGKKMASAAADATKKGTEKVTAAASSAVKKGGEKAASCWKKLDELPVPKSPKLGAWQACKNIVLTCARWLWNLCVACLALGCLAAAICAIASFGFCVVLLCQGYPLGGIALAFFGGSVASVCLTLLVARLLWLKRERVVDASISASDGNLHSASSVPAPGAYPPASQSASEPPCVPFASAATQPMQPLSTPHSPNEVI